MPGGGPGGARVAFWLSPALFLALAALALTSAQATLDTSRGGLAVTRAGPALAGLPGSSSSGPAGSSISEPPSGTREEIPTSLQAAIEKARYAITPEVGAGGRFEGLRGGLGSSIPTAAYVASNHAQSLLARFTHAGVALRPSGGKADWQTRVTLTGLGYGNRLHPPPGAALAAGGSSIELRRGALTEWYRNGPVGLEQGFTLSAPPAREAAEPLVLRMGVNGDLHPRDIGSGERVSLLDRSRRTVLTYSKLFAYDATGNRLEARMSGSGRELSLAVDDGGAAYPLTIDPSFASAVKLEPPPGAGDDEFGISVAMSGDTALVGTYGDDTAAGSDAGSAHVFTRSGTSWSLQRRLRAGDGAAGDYFGYSVALSGDTALVGAYGDDTTAGTDAGSAYVFTRSGTSWSLQRKLSAGGTGTADSFGYSVALRGDTALVGSYHDDSPAGGRAGSAYVFNRSGTSWSLQQKLVAGDGMASDYFGTSVALSGDTALVGAYGDDTGSRLEQGSAYVFTRSGTSWSLQRKLSAGDGAALDAFGYSVALSGDTALVGAYGHDPAGGREAGSAYVFARSGTSWSLERKLSAGDGAFGDYFGYSVALSGETALVGSRRDDTTAGTDAGSAYVFTRNGTSWRLQRKLRAGDGAAQDYFGTSVALSGDDALVGSPLDDTSIGADAGSADVFARSGTSWSLQQRLERPEREGASGSDVFGASVAVSGDTALVGSPSDDTAAGENAGSAYVFTRGGTGWSLQRKLIAGGRGSGDSFGYSVALTGDTALVGASGDDTAAGGEAGSAYVFARSGTSWSLQQKLGADDGAPLDHFGASVAVSGATAVVGAQHDDTTAGRDAGSAYVFDRSGTSWSLQQKLEGDGGAAFDHFGASVALSGDTALVGSPFDDTAAGVNAGAAHVFARSGTSWSLQQELSADDGAAGDSIGDSVALSDDTALVGANHDDTAAGRDAGSAYVFTRSGTSWSLQQKLSAGDGAAFDQFGFSVALSDDTALVGSPADDTTAGTDAGSAYVFF